MDDKFINKRRNTAAFMRLNNRAKVALVTAACLLAQGYVFQFVLEVEPSPLVSLAPFILYVAYLISRGRFTSPYDQPRLWILGQILLTLADVGAYAL
jgi:hypothetical protein